MGKFPCFCIFCTGSLKTEEALQYPPSLDSQDCLNAPYHANPLYVLSPLLVPPLPEASPQETLFSWCLTAVLDFL